MSWIDTTTSAQFFGLMTDAFKNALRSSPAPRSSSYSGSSSNPAPQTPSSRDYNRQSKFIQSEFRNLSRDVTSYRQSVFETLAESAKSNKSFAEKFSSFQQATENLTNARLDALMKSTLGVTGKMNDATSKFLNEHLTALSQGSDPRQFFAVITGLSAAVDNAKKTLSSLSDVMGKNVSSFNDIQSDLDKLNKHNLNLSNGEFTNKKTKAIYNALLSSAADFEGKLSKENVATLNAMRANEKITAHAAKQLAKELSQITPATEKYVTAMEKQLRKDLMVANAKQKAEEAFISHFNLNTLSTVGLLTLLGKSIKGLWDQFRQIAAAGMAQHWADIVGSSLRLGISSEKLTEIMKNNAFTLIKVGGRGFIDRIEKAQDGLMKLGLNAEQAATGAAEFHKTAIDSGIDAKNTDAVNKSIEQQTRAFRQLRAVTGATIEEFNNLNRQILDSTTNQELSLRLAPSERAARHQELLAINQELVQRGLSQQAAVGMIQAMQGFQKNKLTDRLEARARYTQLGGILGMNAEGARAGELAMKRNRTKDEDLEFMKLNANLKGGLSQLGENGMGQENLADMLEENMGTAAKTMLDASVQFKQAIDAQLGITSAEASSAGEASELSEGQKAIAKAQDKLENALKTPLWSLVGIAGGIAVLLAKRETDGLLSKVLDSIKSTITKIPSSISSAFTSIKAFATGPDKLTKIFSAVSSGLTSIFTAGGSVAGSLVKAGSALLKFGTGPIGWITTLALGAYDAISKFGEFMNFGTLGGFLKSLGVIVLSGIKSLVTDVGRFVVDLPFMVLEWIVGDFDLLKAGVSKIRSIFSSMFDFLESLGNTAIGKFLGLGKSAEDKLKIDKKVAEENVKLSKSADKAAASLKQQNSVIEKAGVSSAEWLGVTTMDRVTTKPFSNSNIIEPPSVSQSGSINNKSSADKKSTEVVEVTETKTNVTQQDKSVSQILIEIQKTLDTLVKETTDGTDQTVKAIGQIKLGGQKWLPMFPTSNLG